MTSYHTPTAPLRERRFPRIRGERHGFALAGSVVIALAVLLPIATILYVALTGSGEAWPHLLRYVLPQSLGTTLALLGLVALGTSVIGVGSAWLVVGYDFPLRRLLAWALVGFTSARDYWFPDIRSTWGAALVVTSVTFPYVYLTARVVFLMQGRNIADVARTLGARPSRVFFRVLLPVARPAIIAGLALVMMETLNDIGAVEYLGVRTLTLSVYSTWLNRGSLEGAAQIAAVMLIIVFLLLTAEQWARRKQRFHSARATQMHVRPPRVPLAGARGWLATFALSLPILSGFGVPLFIFGGYVSRRLYQFAEPQILQAFLTSVAVAGVTALLTVFIALLLLNAMRLSRSGYTMVLVRLASVGYALPGTILGLGLLLSLAAIDNTVDGVVRSYTGLSTGLLLTGTAASIVIACTIRFLALAESAIRSGLEKLPPNLDQAARSLGKTANQSAFTVLLPLLKPAILTAAILVFVDTVKELSATILLRPFGFHTLATHVYENASRGAVEDGAVAALLIIATAIVPVILLSGPLMRDRNA